MGGWLPPVSPLFPNLFSFPNSHPATECPFAPFNRQVRAKTIKVYIRGATAAERIKREQPTGNTVENLRLSLAGIRANFHPAAAAAPAAQDPLLGGP